MLGGRSRACACCHCVPLAHRPHASLLAACVQEAPVAHVPAALGAQVEAVIAAAGTASSAAADALRQAAHETSRAAALHEQGLRVAPWSVHGYHLLTLAARYPLSPAHGAAARACIADEQCAVWSATSCRSWRPCPTSRPTPSLSCPSPAGSPPWCSPSPAASLSTYPRSRAAPRHVLLAAARTGPLRVVLNHLAPCRMERGHAGCRRCGAGLQSADEQVVSTRCLRSLPLRLPLMALARDRLRNVELLLCEIPVNFRVHINNWNIRVAEWINTCASCAAPPHAPAVADSSPLRHRCCVQTCTIA